MKSYVFRVELVKEDDGRWSAGVPVLPGCATWGYTREEALRNDTLPPYVIRNLLIGTRWTEGDLRRLGLAR